MEVMELKAGLLTRHSIAFCGRAELLLVWTLAFSTFLGLLHTWYTCTSIKTLEEGQKQKRSPLIQKNLPQPIFALWHVTLSQDYIRLDACLMIVQYCVVLPVTVSNLINLSILQLIFFFILHSKPLCTCVQNTRW